jgi:hypothetical protein
VTRWFSVFVGFISGLWLLAVAVAVVVGTSGGCGSDSEWVPLRFGWFPPGPYCESKVGGGTASPLWVIGTLLVVGVLAGLIRRSRANSSRVLFDFVCGLAAPFAVAVLWLLSFAFA